MSTRPILIIEDDDAFRQILVETISDVGAYVTTEASTAAHATELLSDPDARYDLVLLDLGLPDGDGRTLCHTIRKIGHRMPIIILSGTMDESDVIGGLDAGASDYIMKPIRAAELLARIKAQLRTFEVSEDAVFTIGPYTFRPSQKVLIAPRGRRIRLTHKETTLLRYFYKHQNRVISRVTLLADVWGYNTGAGTHTVETHLWRLRTKIDSGSETRLLVTTGGGYIFMPVIDEAGMIQPEPVIAPVKRAA